MIITRIIFSSGGGEVCLSAEQQDYTISMADARRLGFESLKDEDFPFEYDDEQMLEILSQKLKAIKYCTYLLSFSDKSESCLLRKLHEKKFSIEVCNLALSTLKESGIIDDYSLCLRRLYALSREKLYGPYRLKSELLAKGFNSRDIQNALDDADIDFDSTLKRLFEKLLRTTSADLTDASQIAKFKGKLARFGYSFDAINAVLDSFDAQF